MVWREPRNHADDCYFSLTNIIGFNASSRKKIKYPNLLKESYDNMELLLEAIKYSEYEWSLCGDLKVIDLLMGMQAGFTKYCFFLCLWDSRAVSQHYKQKDWGSKSTFVPGEHQGESSGGHE